MYSRTPNFGENIDTGELVSATIILPKQSRLSPSLYDTIHMLEFSVLLYEQNGAGCCMHENVNGVLLRKLVLFFCCCPCLHEYQMIRGLWRRFRVPEGRARRLTLKKAGKRVYFTIFVRVHYCLSSANFGNNRQKYGNAKPHISGLAHGMCEFSFFGGLVCVQSFVL